MSGRVPPPGTGKLLPDLPDVSSEIQKSIETDYERFAATGLPDNVEDFLLNEYGLDVSSQYGGHALTNPWGKASGQLSMNTNQVREDIDAGLGFVVLKTVIAQDKSGEQSMSAWAIREARMQVEPITGSTGESGWTVTWKGRGWWQSFDEYLRLIRDSRHLADGSTTLVVPSCKYHLPAPGESEWKASEYEYSTRRFLEAWQSHDGEVMPIEKDFSPTLAGSDLATMQTQILEWLRETPRLIRQAAPSPISIGLKVFNAMFDDGFQLDMLAGIHEADAEHRPDFVIYGNRLFDPNREFDGKRGVAYGGSGKMAVEYALRGANSFQMHTFFQLPASEYRMTTGSRTSRALHELYFHPRKGFVLWMLHLRALGATTDVFGIADIPGLLSRVTSKKHGSQNEAGVE